MANTNSINVGIENRNKIVECIKKNGTIKTSDLANKVGMSFNAVNNHLRKLKEENNPNLSFSYGKVKWVDSAEPEKVEKKEEESIETKATNVEKPERYPVHKTDEGYNDYTAGRVAKSMDDAAKEGAFKAGDVWTFDAPYGKKEKYLVIASFDKGVSCLQIREIPQSEYNPVIHALVSMGKKEVVDCRWVMTKPYRYFLEKDNSYNVTNFEAIKRKIACLLDISSVVEAKPIVKTVYRKIEVPVEKVVEKPVEVIKEVEKVIEKPVEVPVALPSDEMELALAKQKADIYERITWAMLVNLGNLGDNLEENT